MGGKRIPKRNPVFFHLAIGLGILAFLLGCQGIGPLTSHREPEYATAFQYLEKVRKFMDEEKYVSALEENARLESHYDYTESRSGDYDRVIRVSARMNTSLLKKVVQDEKTLFELSKKLGQLDGITKKMNEEREKLISDCRDFDTALKTIEDLKADNKMLRQQIKDFKKIDLEGHEIKTDME